MKLDAIESVPCQDSEMGLNFLNTNNMQILKISIQGDLSLKQIFKVQISLFNKIIVINHMIVLV